MPEYSLSRLFAFKYHADNSPQKSLPSPSLGWKDPECRAKDIAESKKNELLIIVVLIPKFNFPSIKLWLNKEKG